MSEMVTQKCIPLLIAFFALASCSNQDNSKVLQKDGILSKDRTNSYNPVFYDYSNTRIDGFSDTVYALFSNDTIEDRFTVEVAEGLVTNTNTIIRVINKKGEIIYENIIPSSSLISGYATEQIKTDSAMEEYILSEAKDILGSGMQNANNLPKDSYLNQAEKQDFTDYETFSKLKNSNRKLFHYRLNEEEHFYLGFSDSKGKVVVIIDCC